MCDQEWECINSHGLVECMDLMFGLGVAWISCFDLDGLGQPQWLLSITLSTSAIDTIMSSNRLTVTQIIIF